MTVSATNSSLKYFINRFLPNWVIEQYGSVGPNTPSIVNFLTYFLDFLNSTSYNTDGSIAQQNPLAVIDQLLQTADIDNTAADFLSHWKATYASNYPYIGPFDGTPQQTISTEIRKLLKHIREFYLSKGTAESMQYFFRSIFGKEILLYYPTTDILRTSDGKWTVPYYLGITNIDGTPVNDAIVAETLGDAFAKGVTSGAAGFVETYASVLYPFAAKAIVTHYYLQMTQVVGAFQEGEQVNFFNYSTNQLIGSYKIKSRGYANIPGTDPAPTSYLGAWGNNVEYQIGQMVYVKPTQVITPANGDLFYICKAGNTSLSLPAWASTQLYRPASVVVYASALYRVKSNRQTYLSETNPYSDLSNWTIIGTSSSGGSDPTWVSGTTYNPYNVVKCQSGVDSVWRQFELGLIRPSFVSSSNPSVDTTNWELLADQTYNQAFIPVWSAAATYYEASEVIYNTFSYRANEIAVSYSSSSTPLVDSGTNGQWNFSTTTTNGSLYPDWSLGQAYNPGDFVLYPSGTTGVWNIYELKPLLPAQFVSGGTPDLNFLNWSNLPTSGFTNYKFDEQDHLSQYWVVLPGTVNPENVGVGNDFPGNWIGTDGWLDSKKKIQDSYFYQAFSYQITVDLDRTAWLKPLTDNVHPAGFQVFNVVQNLNLQFPTGDLGVQFAVPNVFVEEIYYDSLNEWEANNWYEAGSQVQYASQMYLCIASGPFTSNTNPATDTTNWENVQGSALELSRVFRPLVGMNTNNIIGNVSRILAWQDGTDYSSFEKLEARDLPISLLDNYVFSDFRKNAGNQNTLLVQNGLVLLPQPLKDCMNVY